jgi:F-type H+-transporting ATPase subunit delta
MQQSTTIARPYANALFAMSKEDNNASVWQHCLSQIALLIEDKSISRLVSNPKVDQKKLINQINDGFSDAARPKNLLGFLEALLYNKRLLLVSNISEYFAYLVAQNNGSSELIIESAFAMSDAQMQIFVKKLELIFKKKLIASLKIVPELIGGVKAIVGDQVFDFSVQNQLKKMKDNIAL